MEYQFHPITNLFPMMAEEEFNGLRADIQKNGLLEPIWITDHQIIDGRNRYRACQELGIEPDHKEWDKKGSLISFICSLNLHRRHLTPSQKATAAVEALPYFEAEAKERQRAHGETAPGQAKTLPQNFVEVFSKESQLPPAKAGGL